MTSFVMEEGVLKYREIMRDLLGRIEGGRLVPGAQVPPIPELREQYGVSLATVRAALKQLESQGYVSCQRGRGTFVTERRRAASPTLPSMVCFLLVDVSPDVDYDYRGVIDGTERFLTEKGIPFAWATLTSADIIRGRYPAVLEKGLCDGVLLDGHITAAHMALAERFAVKIVVVGSHDIPRDIPQVRTQNRPAARGITSRLAREYSRRVAFVAEPFRLAYTRELAEGYMQGLQDAGVEDTLMYLCPDDIPPNALTRELQGPNPPAVLTTQLIYPRIRANAIQAGLDPKRIPMAVVINEGMAVAPGEPVYRLPIHPSQYMPLAVERLVELMQGRRETVYEDLEYEVIPPEG